MAGITFQIKNLDNLRSELKKINTNSEKAISATAKDLKSRAPAWIAQEVVNVYNIKKSEITPSKDGKKKAGTIRITGETIEDLALVYKGRLLTPVHFGMTPKTPPAGKKYTIKATILKGQKKNIGKYLTTRTRGGPYSERSHYILMSTGASKEGGTPYIPFQRMSKDRNDLKKFTTVSVPQMISNAQVSEAIIKRLNEEAAKRLQHNAERYINK